MRLLNDKELVHNLQNGNNEAFTEIVARYTEKVHNLALRVTRSQEDAEEILQDVFITVYNKIDKFEGKSAFSSWLYRITINTAFMKLRKNKRHIASSLDESQENGKDIDVTPEQINNDSHSVQHELRAELEKAITRLPEEYKNIFILRDIDGLSNQEVSEVIGLSVPAVKSRLHRARLMLRKKLQHYYEDYYTTEIFYSNDEVALAA